MIDDESMMREDESPQVAHPGLEPAAAEIPAPAPLTAPGQEWDEGATPEEEQEDPWAGRSLPAAEDEQAEVPAEDVFVEEDGAAEAPPASPPPATPPPAPEAPPVPAEPAAAQDDAAEAAATDAAREQYWREVLTGALDTVPAAVRNRAGVDDPALSDEQRDYRLSAAINRSWAVDHMGISREQVRARWGQLRAELARRYHVGDDEQELFTALSLEAQDAPQRKRAVSLYEAHYNAALLGQAPPTLPPAEGEEALPHAAELAGEAQRRGAALRERFLPLARELAEGLDVFAGLEDEAIAAPRVFAAVPEYARAVEALADMDESERQLVYALAQAEFRAQHPKQDGSLYRTMLRASRRGASGLGIGVGQAITHAAIASMNSLGSMLGEEAGNTLRGGAAALDVRSRIVEETRRLLYDEVKPLSVSDEAGFVAQLMVDAAGSAPAAVAACCGGAGFATLGFSGMGEAVSAARLRAPEGSQWLQYLAGVVGGGIQASIYAGMGRVGGKMLSNAISNFMRASGKGGGYRLAALGVLGSLGAEEAKLLFASKTAHATTLGAQELAARLEQTASNIDWQEYGDNAQDLELNMREAAMNLPFILIGSGRVALRHFRSRDAVLGEGHALKQWGIDESTRQAIMKEANIDRQGDMLREALRGSKRWSAPGFVMEATRALRLLNSDYYQGFRDPQTALDFLRLPSQGGLLRPPLVEYSADNPEHVRQLEARHGSGESLNRSRLGIALQLWDEWCQRAHLVPTPAEGGKGLPMPTEARRSYFGAELLRADIIPPRLRPGGFYAPQAEAERMAMLRDRVAEIHALSYQMLMRSFPLDAISHSSRGLDQMRKASETGRVSILEAVGRAVLRRAAGAEEHEALDELGKSVSNYVWRRNYSHYPPGWMAQVPPGSLKKLDAYAQGTFWQKLASAPVEFRDMCRIVLGLRACTAALYELLPTTPDFQTSLARGLSPAEAYAHLLSRELEVDITQARGVKEILAPFGPRATDMRSWRLRNEAAFEHYRRFTGCELESARGVDTGGIVWRLRRPNGSYTRWHRRRSDAINDMVANTSFIFMPFSYRRTESLRDLRRAQNYDLNTEGRSGAWQYTGYEQLCRIALRDTARCWVESAPYAQPGFELANLRPYVYLGGNSLPPAEVLMREAGPENPTSMQVDQYTLASPLRLARSRFHTYWWRQLNSGLLPAEQAGAELVKLRIITPEELERVKDIAKPPLMPRNPDTPLKFTPPPDVPGMNRALATHLTEFSMRYFLAHLDDMPLPPSAREWFKLAPLSPLEVGALPDEPRRISLKYDTELLTCLQNRTDARAVRDATPAVLDLRRAEREGLLIGSPLMQGMRDALGFNRMLNLEQAWCAHDSGGEAMMSTAPSFWKLLEQPRAGWDALDAREQRALRVHVGRTCRLEPSSAAVEAEARGESPDHLLIGLQELQDVLADYPNLHQYGMEQETGLGLVRQLTPDAMRQGEDPFAEPEYGIAPLYTGGMLKPGFRLSEPMALPEELQEDPRVLPALHLLGSLRSYPASRPYARRIGIEWRGQLYGGLRGRRPGGLDENWKPHSPLQDLILLLHRVDELKAAQPEGKALSVLEMDIPGLGEGMDFSPLMNITLYRHKENASRLCRLMPGEPDAANNDARAPYVVQSVAGITLARRRELARPEEMYRSYMPLEEFRPYSTRIRRDAQREKFCEESLDYTLSGVLSSTMRMASQSNPKGGIAGMRELLMRFAEDSGFSLRLQNIDPRGLSAGEIYTLRLAREMLHCVCGPEPGAAYRRLIRLAHRVRRSGETRDLVLRILTHSARKLYQDGAPLFRTDEEIREKQQARREQKQREQRESQESDIRLLDKWFERQGKKLPRDLFDDDGLDSGHGNWYGE